MNFLGADSPLESARQRAEDWAKETEVVMESHLSGHSDSGILRNSLKYRIAQHRRAAVALRITFKFVRHGAFLEKGARRGYGGTIGSEFGNYKTGVVRRTNPDSLGKMGTGASPAVPWTKPALDKQLPELADMVGEVYDRDILSTFRTVLLRFQK